MENFTIFTPEIPPEGRAREPHPTTSNEPGRYLKPHLRVLSPGKLANGVATIHKGRDRDVKFLIHLQREYPNAIGFLPTQALENYLQAGRVKITTENGEAAGFILAGRALRWQPLLRPIYQAAVAMDATRRHHGLALLADIEAEAKAAGQIGLQANCAAELEANEFWKAAGFVAIGIMTPDNARRRDIICWRKPLTRSLPTWFAHLPQRAGHSAKTVISNRQKSLNNWQQARKPHALFKLYGIQTPH